MSATILPLTKAQQVHERAEVYSGLFEALQARLGIRGTQIRLMKRVLSDDKLSTLEQAALLAGVPEEVLAQGWTSVLQKKLAQTQYPKHSVTHLNYAELYQLSADVQRAAGGGLNTSATGPLSLLQRLDNTQRRILLVATDYDVANILPHLGKHEAIIVATTRTVQCAYFRYINPPIEDFWRSLDVMESEDVSTAGLPGGEAAVESAWVALLRHAAFLGASDVQLLCSPDQGAVKLRVDGVYSTLRFVRISVYNRLLTRLMGLVGVTAEDLGKTVLKEGTFDFGVAGLRKLDELKRLFAFRPQIGSGASGRTATIRILNRAGAVANFDALGFSEADADYLRGLMDLGDGLVLISGPTGSGKTNTLDALVQLIDPEGRSVQTLENPVEFVDPRRLQYETRSHERSEGEMAENILMGLLRNDPDVIIVGETRSATMIQTCFRASRTGHLVLSTVHADDAGGTVYQLRRWDISPEDIAAQLRAIIALRLVRLLCVGCRVKRSPEEVDHLFTTEAYRPYESVISLWAQHAGDRVKNGWWRASESGCVECSFTGYRGRRLVYELLRGDPRSKSAIRQGAASVVLNRALFRINETLAGRALMMVLAGRTSIEEVRAVTPFDAGMIKVEAISAGSQK